MRTLRFPKFGSIDKVSDYAQGKAIYVDVDGHDLRGKYTIPHLYSICRIIGLKPECTCYHRTKRGWHIIILLAASKLSPSETIAAQAIFGSDPMREALNLMRVLSMKGKRIPKFWKQRWNILYDYKV